MREWGCPETVSPIARMVFGQVSACSAMTHVCCQDVDCQVQPVPLLT